MRLYNTLTRNPDPLPPISAGAHIRMYFCGPTVYARAHIGNARPFILGMWVRSWLRSRGYRATLVHNITDINDKIYDAAPGASAELAKRATAWYLEDVGDFGLGMPDHLPKATEYIEQIIAFINELIERHFAYAIDGDVYFRVSRLQGYGRLSGQKPNQMEDQEPNPRKEDPRDFALWKANKPGEDTSWRSPWGLGRPGWHIECSVMAEALLGPVFEIHGGGLDLVFPHHENELAQSNALDHDFAEIWMHNGMLQFVGEKMSKSTGNITTMREALDEWGKETLLLFYMTAHWRKPIDFSEAILRTARTQASIVRNAYLDFPWRVLRRHSETGANEPEFFELPEVEEYLLQLLISGSHGSWQPGHGPPPMFRLGEWSSQELGALFARMRASRDGWNVTAEETARFEWGRFIYALDEDFNLPEALSLIRRWVRLRRLGLAYAGLAVFGLTSLTTTSPSTSEAVVALAVERSEARAAGEWHRADDLRQQIESLGFEVRDVSEPPGFLLVPIDKSRA